MGSFYACKGFEHDLTCRGFQYEIGKTYTIEDKPKICEQGFHCCVKLSDVFAYYPIVEWKPSTENDEFMLKTVSTKNRYCIVEVLGDIDVDQHSSKLSTNKIKIILELTRADIIRILNTERVEIANRYKIVDDLLQKIMHVKTEEDE